MIHYGNESLIWCIRFFIVVSECCDCYLESEQFIISCDQMIIANVGLNSGPSRPFTHIRALALASESWNVLNELNL